MKTTILVSLFLTLTTVYCISQKPVKSQFKLDALDLKIIPPTLGSQSADFVLKDSIFNCKGLYKYLKTPELKAQKKNNTPDKLVLRERRNTTYNMPCYKPEIKSEMPILEPDSTIRYSLLILEK